MNLLNFKILLILLLFYLALFMDKIINKLKIDEYKKEKTKAINISFLYLITIMFFYASKGIYSIDIKHLFFSTVFIFVSPILLLKLKKNNNNLKNTFINFKVKYKNIFYYFYILLNLSLFVICLISKNEIIINNILYFGIYQFVIIYYTD